MNVIITHMIEKVGANEAFALSGIIITDIYFVDIIIHAQDQR